MRFGHLVLVAVVASAAPCVAATPEYTATSLTPAGYLDAFFQGAGGNQAVGYGDFEVDIPGIPGARDVHAFVWNQDTQTMVDLDPGGITSATYAYDTFGGVQAGRIITSAISGGVARDYGAVWQGSAASLVVLDTPGVESSAAYATSLTRQVGNAIPAGANSSVPFTWAGTGASGRPLAVPTEFVDPGYGGAASAISGERIIGTAFDPNGFAAAVYWQNADAPAQVLRPATFDETFGVAVNGSRTLVEAAGATGRHLFVEDLDAGTSVDLHPAGALFSYGSDLNATAEVGIVALADPLDENNRFEHAAVWFGSAESFVDLHLQLPPELSGYLYSRATGIDDAGNIYGTVYNTPTGPYVAVRWSAIPEPTTLVAAGAMTTLFIRRRR